MIVALFKLLATVIFLGLGLLLGLSNTTPIAVSLLHFSSPELPFFAWLLLTFLLGMLITAIFTSWRLFRLQRKHHQRQQADLSTTP